MNTFPDFIAEIKSDFEHICPSVFHLAHIDNVFWQVQAVIRENSSIREGDIFQEWMESCYAESILVGLRRLVDTDKRTLSLWRLLEKIRKRAPEFTRDWFVNLHDRPMRARADKWFSELVGGEQKQLTRAIVRAKQDNLKASLQSVETFVNDYVAHTASQASSTNLSYQEVRRNLVDVFRTLQWLGRIIDSSAINSPVPFISPNWLSIFRTPWLPSEQKPPKYIRLEDLLFGNGS